MRNFFILLALIFIPLGFSHAQTPELLYERITGVSNPGGYNSSNLTSGIGGAVVSGKTITSFAINARTNGTQSNVLLTVYENGTPVSSVVVAVTTQSTAIWTDFVLPTPINVTDGTIMTIRPTLDSGDNGYPYGEAGGTGSWNLRVYGYDTPSQNTTWNNDNGFWGDVTATDIKETMQASVQATGVNIWPLFTFVGIPVAFLIALYLVWLINKTLTPPKKSEENIINPQGENLIYHSAEDLEFKREYGQTKRKRGRPRKYPL